MFTVQQARAFFFDRPAVQNAADSATRKNLSKFGAFTRRNARDLLRYRKRTSSPGEPPSVHKTAVKSKRGKDGAFTLQAVSPLKENIFFSYEPGTKSVVIGPARLNKPGDAPHALEYGGSSTVTRDGNTVTLLIEPRPYMRPSFQKAQRDLPDIWRDSIQK